MNQFWQVYARTVAAEMIKGQCAWDRAYEQFISEAVGKVVTFTPPAFAKHAVAMIPDGSSPNPTGVCFVDAPPETSFGAKDNGVISATIKLQCHAAGC